LPPRDNAVSLMGRRERATLIFSDAIQGRFFG
jgi:hypothetical protein